MNQIPHDPDVREIIRITESLYPDYSNVNLAWKESPFAWIKSLPSKTVGKVGEQIIERWCISHNFEVRSSPDSEADRIINGLRVEIKFSTLWKSGIYKFQQLRNQAYDVVICLGISPFNAHCWVLSKNLVLEKWESGEISSQHGGRSGQDTAWIEVNPNNIQDWLAPPSGSPTEAIQILRKLTNTWHGTGNRTSRYL